MPLAVLPSIYGLGDVTIKLDCHIVGKFGEFGESSMIRQTKSSTYN